MNCGFVYEKLRKASGSIDARRFLSWIGVRCGFSAVKSSSKFEASPADFCNRRRREWKERGKTYDAGLEGRCHLSHFETFPLHTTEEGVRTNRAVGALGHAEACIRVTVEQLQHGCPFTLIATFTDRFPLNDLRTFRKCREESTNSSQSKSMRTRNGNLEAAARSSSRLSREPSRRAPP